MKLNKLKFLGILGMFFAQYSQAQDPFITTWTVSSMNQNLTIFTGGGDDITDYDCQIDWGDGTIQDITGDDPDPLHTYPTTTTVDTFSVSITGTFPHFFLNNSPNRNRLLSVDQWGDIAWESMDSAFYGATRMKLKATDTPDLSSVSSMSAMFQNTTNFKDINNNLSNWNVSQVIDMSYMFYFSGFSGGLSDWNVSQVTDMIGMFFNATRFNGDLSNWNVSNVEKFNAFLIGSNMSTYHYDKLLISWNKLTLQRGATFDAGLTRYHARAQASRDSILTDYGWTITDGGIKLPSLIKTNGLPDLTLWEGFPTYYIDFDTVFMEADSLKFTATSSDENVITVDIQYDTLILTGVGSGTATIEVTARDDYEGEKVESFNITIQKGFITTWETSSGNTSITIPTRGTSNPDYDFWIDWGDGSDMQNFKGDEPNTSHDYTVGTFRVTITGTFPQFYLNNSSDKTKLRSIDQWGYIVWESMSRAFYGAENMVLNATDTPDLSNVTSMFRMFQNASALRDIGGSLSNWNVSKVTSMSSMFENTTVFTQNLNDWNVSKVTGMSRMFKNASMFNANLSNWNVSKVTSMSSMFGDATAFNQDISQWEVSKVTNMSGMFENATAFNQDISQWEVSEVTNMSGMFENAAAFNQNISQWEVSEVSNFTDFLTGSGLSTYHYDTLLISWSKLALSDGISSDKLVFNAGTIKYRERAAIARQSIIDDHEWDIQDGGKIENNSPSIAVSLPDLRDLLLKEGFTTFRITVDTVFSDPDGDTLTITASSTDKSVITARIEEGALILTEVAAGTADINLSVSDNYGGVLDIMFPVTIQKPFITIWETTSENETITIPTQGGATATDYDFQIDWGDGTEVQTFTGDDPDPQHEYNSINASIRIGITGVFPHLALGTGSAENAQKLKSVEQWGGITWESMSSAFNGASNMVLNAPDAPSLSSVTDMSNMFKDAIRFNGDLSGWDVSNITNMDSMFLNAETFNGDLSGWDVSSVTTFKGFLVESGFSTLNYDKLLISWSSLELQEGVTFDAGNILYRSSAKDARNSIVTIRKWIINDGGIMVHSIAQAVPDLLLWKGFSSHRIYISDVFTDDSGPLTFTTNSSDESVVMANIEGDSLTLTEGVPGISTITLTATNEDREVVNDLFDVSLRTGFVTAWAVAAPNDSIIISTIGGSAVTDYDFWINWGDGTPVMRVQGNDPDPSHKYTSADTFTVTITGTFPRINLGLHSTINAQKNAQKLVSINQWGGIAWESMAYAFHRARNMTLKATDIPNLSGVTDLSYMFSNTDAFNQDISNWNVSNVTNMNNMFSQAIAFNQDLSNWDVSSVMNMGSMFFDATVFNGDISNWNVSNVADMSNMFGGNEVFNRDLSTWVVSSATNMMRMFYFARAFNQDLSNWDVSKVSNFTDFLTGSGLSTYHYDTLLISWSKLDLYDGMPSDKLVFNAGTITYRAHAQAARQSIETDNNWMINDGGTVGNRNPSLITELPNLILRKGFVSRQIDLATVFMDPDGDPLTFTASSDDKNVATVSLRGNTLTLMEAASTGAATITITARDGYRGMSTDIFNVKSYSKKDAFITTWKTTSNNETIVISTEGGSDVTNFDFQIDWGDGTIQDITGDDPNPNHKYASADTFIVAITGTFPHLNLLHAPSHNNEKLLSIEQWGNIEWENMAHAFYDARNMVLNATDTPILSSVSSMLGMFWGATSFNGDLSGWDVSQVTDMSQMFNNATTFNQDISGWNVANVRNMRAMFFKAAAFSGSRLGEWNVANVEDMSYMFSNTSAPSADISNWNVSKVTDMNNMFSGNKVFNGNLNNWDVSEVTDMRSMFSNAIVFNEDLSDWNVSKVTNMEFMFSRATVFNQDISGWNVFEAINMEGMFSRATVFNQDISNWNVSKVTNMRSMFDSAVAFNQNISNWNVSKVRSMSWIFQDAAAFNQDISSWDFSDVSYTLPIAAGLRHFLTGSGFSTYHYDTLLINLNKLDLQDNVVLGAVVKNTSNETIGIKYRARAQAARQALINDHSWVIIDGGITDNTLPTAIAGGLRDTTLESGALYQINLDTVFTDADGDPLTFTASSDESKVIVSIRDNILTFTKVALGMSPVSLRVDDSYGGILNTSFTVTFAGNIIPKIVKPLPDITLGKDFDSYEIDLSNTFTDDQELIFSAMSTDDPMGDIVAISIEGNILTLTEVGIGEATIIVTADDGMEQTEDTFVVMVIENVAPRIANPIEDLTLRKEFGTHTLLGIENIFRDEGSLTLLVNVDPLNVVSVSLTGDTLTITEVGIGEAMIIVTADDGMASTKDTFVVMVIENVAPRIANPIEDLTLREGFETHTLLGIENIFRDDESLTLSVSVDPLNVVSVLLTGDTLTITEMGIGEATIIVTADDGIAQTKDSFNLVIENVAPIIANPIEDLTLRKEFGTHTLLGIENIFRDEQPLTLSVNDPPNVVSVLLTGDTLTITEVGIGEATIIITADDGMASTNDTFVVMVIENVAPRIANPIEDLTLREGFETHTLLGIENIFRDEESLTLSVSINPSNVASVNLSGDTLTITEIGIGEATIIVTADDEMVQTKDSFNLVIENVAPRIANPIKDLTLREGFEPHTLLGIENIFRDEVSLTLSVSINPSNVANVSLSGDSLTITETGIGEATIIVTADDGMAQTNDSFNLVIENVAPRIANPIEDIALRGGFHTHTLMDIENTFRDGQPLTLSFNVDPLNVVSVILTENVLTIIEIGLGEATITLTADDGMAQTKDMFIVTVDGTSITAIDQAEKDVPTLYPNPTTGSVSVDIGNLEKVSIKIYAPSGQVFFYQENVENSIHNLEFSGGAGIYFMEIKHTDGKQVLKLIRK